MSSKVLVSCFLLAMLSFPYGGLGQSTTTEIPLPPHVTSMNLDDLLNDGTVFDGSEDPTYDWGDLELPIVRSGRTEPLTPKDLKNATMIASGYKEAFLLWKGVYGRSYVTTLEEQTRYRNFLRNMGSAFYNQTINPHALFGANNFSDYSPLEFQPYHNLTDTYERFTNKSSVTRGPTPTGEDGYDILKNPFGQDFALYDQQGEFTVLGRGSSFWRNPNGNSRKLHAQGMTKEASHRAQGIARESSQSQSSSVVSASEGSLRNGIKALRDMLSGHESTPTEEDSWAKIEAAYTSVRNGLARFGDSLWSERRGEGPSRELLNAASDFNKLETQYFKKKSEREEKLLNADDEVGAAKRGFLAAADVPTVLDWRSYGAVSPVRQQGNCGGCWAFATAGNIEGIWRIAGKPLTQLSEQALISCDTFSGNLGCAGGVPQYAFNYIIKYQQGLAARLDSYPFVSEAGVAPLCASSKYVSGAAINRYVSIAKDEDVMQKYVANIGPIAVAVDSTSWISYTGGIITDCLSLGVDHAVLIVGYDIAHYPPYWIVKNSWGTDWGENGYVRIAKGSNQCLITKNPSTALANVAAVIATPSTTSQTTTQDAPTTAPVTSRPNSGGVTKLSESNPEAVTDASHVISAGPPPETTSPFVSPSTTFAPDHPLKDDGAFQQPPSAPSSAHGIAAPLLAIVVAVACAITLL